MSIPSRYGTVFQAILQHATQMTAFAAPWGFVPPNADCYTGIADPASALQHLLNQFDGARLVRAGVMTRAPDGECRLAPALCDPSSIIVALRAGIGREPFALLTQAGCLPVRRQPIPASMRDFYTRSLAREHGYIVATTSIVELALYRSLGLPVTLCIGLRSLSMNGLQAIDNLFQNLGPSPAAEFDLPEVPAAARPKAPPAPPNLRPCMLLAGWSLLNLKAEPETEIRDVAAYLLEVRKQLDINFEGIAVAEPSGEIIERLRFRATFARVGPVRELLIKYGLTSNRCMEYLCGATGPRLNDLPALQNELLAAYASGSGNDSHSTTVQAARTRYEEAVRRDMTDPLMRKGLSLNDPVEGAVHVQLATVANLFHNMAPAVIDLQRRTQYTARLRDDEALIPEKVFKQFRAVSSQVTETIVALARLRGKGGAGRGR
jgi:hypothetical protein